MRSLGFVLLAVSVLGLTSLFGGITVAKVACNSQHHETGACPQTNSTPCIDLKVVAPILCESCRELQVSVGQYALGCKDNLPYVKDSACVPIVLVIPIKMICATERHCRMNPEFFGPICLPNYLAVPTVYWNQLYATIDDCDAGVTGEVEDDIDGITAP
jgi:hypothetical protein